MDPKRNAGFLALGYGVLSLFWVISTDIWVAYTTPAATIGVHMLKGTVFVLVSTLILFFVSRAVFMRLSDINALREDELVAERRELGRVVARTLVHDTRNVMMIFQSNIDFLRTTASDPQVEALEDLDEAMSDLEALIEHLREGSATTTELEKIELAEILRLCTRVIRSDDRFREVNMNLTSTDPGMILGNPVLLRQAFINLFVNSAEAGATVIDVSLKEVDDCAHVCVKDNGPGMSEENLERAFRPFFSTKGRGSGLGLVSVHQTLDFHGGTIQVANRSESGFAITMVLPLAPTLASAASSN